MWNVRPLVPDKVPPGGSADGAPDGAASPAEGAD